MTTGLCALPAMGTASGNAIANKIASPIGLTKLSTANARMSGQGSKLWQQLTLVMFFFWYLTLEV